MNHKASNAVSHGVTDGVSHVTETPLVTCGVTGAQNQNQNQTVVKAGCGVCGEGIHPCNGDLGAKRCGVCEQVKPLTEFYSSKRDGYQSQCKSCKRAYNDANAERIRARHYDYLVRTGRVGQGGSRGGQGSRTPFPRALDRRRERLYGITEGEFEHMLISQAFSCALCFSRDPLLIDHCHETGRVRGLLCRACNFALGFLRDRSDVAARAVAYLAADPYPDAWMAADAAGFGGGL